MTARFLQIHTLTNYPASLLNRDDAGFAKRMPFGGAVRTRISSQCLKRHWRMYDGENSLKTIDAPESVRSRVAFEKYVVAPLVKDGVAEQVARVAAQKIIGIVFGSEAKEKKADRKAGSRKGKKQEPAAGQAGSDTDAGPPVADFSDGGVVKTAQVTVLGRPELDYLCELARQAIKAGHSNPEGVEKALDERMKDDKEIKKNIQALKPGSLEAGLGAALFGRMVTGDILSRTDGAIHVAHAITVHGQMVESDYFTAIDDLSRDEGEQGSGHINASELTSGLFYGYVVVDTQQLVDNLGGDRVLGSEVVHRLVSIVATVSPGAKKGSTAPYAYSHLVLVESGKAQPRTLQNAFLEPVRTTGNLVRNTYDAMRHHLKQLDEMYGKAEQRAHAGLEVGDLFENKKTLNDLATWVKARVIE